MLMLSSTLLFFHFVPQREVQGLLLQIVAHQFGHHCNTQLTPVHETEHASPSGHCANGAVCSGPSAVTEKIFDSACCALQCYGRSVTANYFELWG